MDVCKIGHHGSNTSTSWTLLDHAQCSIAIISAGIDNRYGHPHKEVLDRLKRNGSLILNTQIHGDIRFSFTRFFNLITTSFDESVIIIKE
jgi:competence protein ComEC